jgi:hypothetical protein
MKSEKEINMAIKYMQDFLNTEVCRALWSKEGKEFLLDRINVLRWVLEE